MANLVALIVSRDEPFRTQLGRLLRSCTIPVSVADEGAQPSAADLILVDGRSDLSSAVSVIERARAAAPAAGIFMIAQSADPDVIVEAMRAGANEFFTWPPPNKTFHEAIRRAANRREAQVSSSPGATTLVFFGAKGGTGTTTIGVNCGVDLARLTKRSTLIVDLQPGLGEVGLFLGVRPKHTLLDAIDNLHRLDREFLNEIVTTHKSGLDILAGSDNFDRPAPTDSSAIEELLRFLSKQYDHIVIDAGSRMDAAAVVALYAADQILLVATPDVPSIRNSQRLLERLRQSGSCGERVRFLLNRASEPMPIPQKQIEAAVGCPVHHTFPSDYKTVSAALNAGVPLALVGNSEVAGQFSRFTRRLIKPDDEAAGQPAKQGFSLARVASLW